MDLMLAYHLFDNTRFAAISLCYLIDNEKTFIVTNEGRYIELVC